MRIYRRKRVSSDSGKRASTGAQYAERRHRSSERIKSAIERFNVDHDILEVLAGTEPVYKAGTSGGEYASTEGCPACGEGHDRLRIWPQHPTKGAWAWCRQCRNFGDALKWTMFVEGLDPSRKGSTATFLREHGYLPESARRPTKSTRAVATNGNQGRTVQEILEGMERIAGHRERRRKTSAPTNTPDTPDSSHNSC